MSVSLQELKRRQAWPLAEKVQWALHQIRLWYDTWNGKVYVSYSGGKDSTVLLNLVRSLYPDVPAVFSNTGLEYPEIVEFVKATPNVVIVRPKMTYRRVLEEHGYPVVSKKTAKALRVLRENKPTTANTRRLHMTGEKADGTFSKHFLLAEKWKFLLKAPFKISEKCCDIIKLKPIHEYEKKTGLVPYVGTMAKDSRRRSASYLMTGCNSINSKKGAPLSIWTEKDVWNYIRGNEIPYSKIYDMGYDRTGCAFCAFGAHLEPKPGRFVLLRKTHPKLWKHCMETLGMREVLRFVGVPTGDDRSLTCLR